MSSNNKYCGHKIESFKFKLFRKIYYKLPNGKKISTCDYLTYQKITGAKRGEIVAGA